VERRTEKLSTATDSWREIKGRPFYKVSPDFAPKKTEGRKTRKFQISKLISNLKVYSLSRLAESAPILGNSGRAKPKSRFPRPTVECLIFLECPDQVAHFIVPPTHGSDAPTRTQRAISDRGRTGFFVFAVFAVFSDYLT
jgi:hypothetical protein